VTGNGTTTAEEAMTMKHSILRMVAMAALIGVGAPALAQEEGSAKNQPPRAGETTIKQTPGGVTGERRQNTTVTVDSVDKDRRSLTYTNMQGHKDTVQVPEGVQGLERIKSGDKVDLTFYESLALSLNKPGEGKPAEKAQEGSYTIPGVPGKVAVRQTDVTAKVVAVDPKKHQVTLRGPGGEEKTVTVQDPDVRQKLTQIKAGDDVEAVYTEAVAVAIKPKK
jgi:hypothetical protein